MIPPLDMQVMGMQSPSVSRSGNPTSMRERLTEWFGDKRTSGRQMVLRPPPLFKKETNRDRQ
jgi:hypothetical protein